MEWRNREVDFFDNSVICDLVERNHCGILSTLDEVALRKASSRAATGVVGFFGVSSSSESDFAPSALSNAFMERLGDSFKQHPHLELSSVAAASAASAAVSSPESSGSRTQPHHCFKVKHFAGAVTYDARDFVKRDVDTLDKDLSRAMFHCQHPMLKTLFPEGEH